MNNPSKLVRSVLAIAGFCAVMGVQSASAQGFFQMLFGGGQQQPREGRSAYERDYGRQNNLFGYGRDAGYGSGTLDPDDPRLHREIIRRRAAVPHNGESHGGSSGRQTPIVATTDAPRGSLAFFEKDKTLRAGDVVVTEKGFLVFQGGSDHSARSFVAINNSGTLKTDRVNLLALEHQSSLRTPNVTVEAVPAMRDFIGPRTAEQMEALASLRGTLTTATR